jgi:hypothetical protein
MSEMVERVARALYERRWREVKGQAEQQREQQFELSVYREHYLADARAAIEAMREPTEGMFIAGVACMAAFADHPDQNMSFPILWGHVIDEALR